MVIFQDLSGCWKGFHKIYENLGHHCDPKVFKNPDAYGKTCKQAGQKKNEDF